MFPGLCDMYVVLYIPLNSFFPFLFPQREKSGVPQIFRRKKKKKKKKFRITFFIFPEICPKFTNARASFETNYFFFFGLSAKFHKDREINLGKRKLGTHGQK